MAASSPCYAYVTKQDDILPICPIFPVSRRASRGHEAARSEKLLRLLSDRAQTLHNDRTFYSKQSYRFCFLF